MIEAPIPPDEVHRLALLKACHIMNTPDEESFDDVAQLAADICGTEIALITLVDADRQWFKARVGVEQTETTRDLSFCAHCITKHEPLVVEDTLLDPRFADNPLVTGDPWIRFYVGVPLVLDEGSCVGALSVADRKPRTITPREIDALQRLARQISRELGLRRQLDRAGIAVPGARSNDAVGTGTILGGTWRLGRELGHGGMGRVFEAFDRNERRVAIKVLLREWRSNAEVVERFAREARVLMRLKTPHVARLFDVGNLDVAHGDLPFIVLELLEGEDLHETLAREHTIAPAKALTWGADACAGVAEAHELGVVHRDLKPSNVFIATHHGEDPIVKVLDFGIAAGDPTPDHAVKLTNVGTPIGSPHYMSPEQMMAAIDLDGRSDVWSMGVTLYQLLTGELPFPGTSHLEIVSKVLTRPPVPLPETLTKIFPDVEPLLFSCLEKKREKRCASMIELEAALRRIAAT